MKSVVVGLLLLCGCGKDCLDQMEVIEYQERLNSLYRQQEDVKRLKDMGTISLEEASRRDVELVRQLTDLQVEYMEKGN